MTEPLDIALLSLHSSPIGSLGTADTGGMSIYLLELAAQLAGRGHRIDIFTRALGADDGRSLDHAANIRIVRLAVANTEHLLKSELYGFLPDYQKEIEKFCRTHRRRYHILHSNYWLSAVVGDRLRSAWGCPHLITFHTLARSKTAARQDHREDRLRVAEEERLLTCCDGVMVASAVERAELVDCPGGAPIHLVPLGVDLERFKPSPHMFEKEAGSGRRPPVILFVGRFDPMKGVDTAITALALLGEESEAELQLVGGDGPESAAGRRLRGLVGDLGLGSRVRFAGAVAHQHMPEVYRQAAMAVIPSYYESFGLTVLEALASGIPVAATPTGVAVDTIRPGINGYLATIGDPRSLARAMAETLALARHQRPQIIRQSVQSYDWSRVADLVLSVYSGAISQKNTPKPANDLIL